MDFLNINNKTFLITGIANKRSIAYCVANKLSEHGARLVICTHKTAEKKWVRANFPKAEVYQRDLTHNEEIQSLAEAVKSEGIVLDGILHSVAFFDYTGNKGAFHEIKKESFLQAMDVSCFSLIDLCRSLKDCLDNFASVLTVSFPNVLWEPYGAMGPVKSALNATMGYMAKSFSHFSKIRFNAICPVSLMTRSAAGIPGFLELFLFQNDMNLRKSPLTSEEVANVAAFLLSGASTGINGQILDIDAGLRLNAYDTGLVHHYVQSQTPRCQKEGDS